MVFLLVTPCLAQSPPANTAASTEKAQGEEDARALQLGQPNERELAGEQAHNYLVELAKGQYCFVAVDQRGVDVVVTVYAPDGKKVRKVNSADGPNETEFVYLIAESAGAYRFEVRAAQKGPVGKYQVTLREQRYATGEDRQYLGELALSEARRLDDSGTLQPAATNKNLYPSDANARTEIDEGLKRAARDHKRVLLMFGANWCYDCHVLDRALRQGKAGQIMEESFVLVHVDIGESDKNLDLAQRYKIPLEKGAPAVVILDSNGELLYGSADGAFEAARRMMKRDLTAFLLRWKENTPPANGKN